MIPITCNAVGDIIALTTLVLDAIRALNDARGSAAEHRRFKNELKGLHTILEAAARVANDSANGALREEIIREVDECGQDVQEALRRVAKFSAMGDSGDGLRARATRTRYKLEWRFARRDEVQTARKELAMATQRLTTLLVLSNACAQPRAVCMLCADWRYTGMGPHAFERRQYAVSIPSSRRTARSPTRSSSTQ